MLFILANKNKIIKKTSNQMIVVAAPPPLPPPTTDPQDEDPVVAFDIIYDCSTNISHSNHYTKRKNINV